MSYQIAFSAGIQRRLLSKVPSLMKPSMFRSKTARIECISTHSLIDNSRSFLVALPDYKSSHALCIEGFRTLGAKDMSSG